MNKLVLSAIEQDSILYGIFPVHSDIVLPTDYHDWKNFVIYGTYQSQQEHLIEDTTNFKLEPTQTSNDLYCFLYQNKYHFLKIKEVISLDVYDINKTLCNDYIALSYMHPDTFKICKELSKKRYTSLFFKYENKEYKQLLLERQGVYNMKKFIAGTKKEPLKDDSWKWDIDIDKLLYVRQTYYNNW